MLKSEIKKRINDIISAYNPDKKMKTVFERKDIPVKFADMCKAQGCPINVMDLSPFGAAGMLYPLGNRQYEIRLDEIFGQSMRALTHELAHFFDNDVLQEEWKNIYMYKSNMSDKDFYITKAYTRGEFVAELSSKIICDVYGFEHLSQREDICTFLKTMYQMEYTNIHQKN